MYRLLFTVSFIILSVSLQSGYARSRLEQFSPAENEKQLNILVLGEPVRSHLATLLTVGEELAHRGHNVTLITVVFEKDQTTFKTIAEKHGIKLWNVSARDLAQLDLVQLSKTTSKAFFSTLVWTIRPHYQELKKIMVAQVNKTLSEDSWDIVLGSDYMQDVMACMQSTYNLPFMTIGANLDIGAYDYPPWSYPGLLEGAASDNMKFTGHFVGVFTRFLHTALYYFLFSHPSTDY